MKNKESKRTEIGARIRMVREMAGLSQGQVAKLKGSHGPHSVRWKLRIA